MSDLIKLIEKINDLIIEIKKHYVKEIKKHNDKKLKLEEKLLDGCKHAGEIRGHIKALVKEIGNHGNLDNDVMGKLSDKKKELEEHEKQLCEVELRESVDAEAKEVERLESELAVISR